MRSRSVNGFAFVAFSKDNNKYKTKKTTKAAATQKKQCDKDTRSLKLKCNKRRCEKERARLN